MYVSYTKVVGLVIKFAIENVSEPILGVPIEVETSVLDVMNGFVNVRKLVICNPQGFTGPYLMKLDTLVVKLNVWKLITSFGKTIEIQWLELTGLWPHGGTKKR